MVILYFGLPYAYGAARLSHASPKLWDDEIKYYYSIARLRKQHLITHKGPHIEFLELEEW